MNSINLVPLRQYSSSSYTTCGLEPRHPITNGYRAVVSWWMYLVCFHGWVWELWAEETNDRKNELKVEDKDLYKHLSFLHWTWTSFLDKFDERLPPRTCRARSSNRPVVALDVPTASFLSEVVIPRTALCAHKFGPVWHWWNPPPFFRWIVVVIWTNLFFRDEELNCILVRAKLSGSICLCAESPASLISPLDVLLLVPSTLKQLLAF